MSIVCPACSQFAVLGDFGVCDSCFDRMASGSQFQNEMNALAALIMAEPPIMEFVPQSSRAQVRIRARIHAEVVTHDD